jgi:hypothetical protein
LEIVPLCPFEAGAFLWEAQPGQPSLTVLVKATFALAPGELSVASAQDPLDEERHFEDSALASLYWPGDFAPVKRKVDVMLVGHAYAPHGQPVEALVARLTVGDFTKSVRVFGDRVWTRDAAGQVVPSAPSPFARMPIRYERAPLSADNPAGVDGGVLAAAALPNLEPDDEAIIPCFGPISPQWRSRRRLLDEASTFWAYGVARAPRDGAPPIGAAPPRFDFAFFNAAPPDQQLDLLRAGAPVVLDNLDPEHPRLETRLPVMRPQVFRVPPPEISRGRVEEIILRCDSLWIDTDRRVLTLTWRGLTDIAGGIARVGTLVVDADPDGKKLRWDRVEKRFAEVRPPTLRLGNDTAPKSARSAIVTGPDPLGVRYDGRARPPDGPAAARNATLTEAVGPVSLVPNSEQIRDDPTNPLPPREPVASRPGAFRAVVPAPGKTRAPMPPKPSVTRPPASVTKPFIPKPSAPRSTPKPAPPVAPDVVGDKPKPLLVLGASAPKPAVGAAAPPVDGGSKLASKPHRKEPGPALRKDLDVERYGSICAELARKGASRAAVLKTHLLTEPVWGLVDTHWKRALADEAEEGGRALLLAFDEAYIATQERLGTSVGVPEYARIQVAIERGEIGRVLGEMSLELGDLMRLQRVWTKRLSDSPSLSAELARAVEQTRRAM